MPEIFERTHSTSSIGSGVVDMMIKGNILMRCDLKPENDICFTCMDDQITSKTELKCSECKKRIRNCTVLAIKTPLFGKDYALVERGGSIEKVLLNRIINISYYNI